MPGYGPENTPLKRIRLKDIRDALLNVFNLDRGIGYTLVNLAIRPGEAINTYLFENRSKLVKPIGFLIFTVTIATFLTVNFVDLVSTMPSGFEDMKMKDGQSMEGFMEFSNDMFGQFYNVLSLFAVPMLAIASYAVFNDHRYTYAEHLVISTYMTGFVTVCYILAFPFFAKWYQLSSVVYILIIGVYWVFAYVRIFGESSVKGILKGIGTQLLYYTLFMVLAFVLSIFMGIYWALKIKGKI